MKKILLYSILSVLLLISCELLDQYKNYRLDGMWQLKTVQDIDGSTTHVDTIYYSFQRGGVFSYTVLENPKVTIYLIYGYVDRPSDDKVHVLIDNNAAGNDNFEWFLNHSKWSAADIIFDIKKYDKSDLVLFDSGNGKTFFLKKF